MGLTIIAPDPRFNTSLSSQSCFFFKTRHSRNSKKSLRFASECTKTGSSVISHFLRYQGLINHPKQKVETRDAEAPIPLKMTMTHPSGNPSPSFTRRKALREADEANQTRVIDSYPLSKYFIIAQRLFTYFQQSFEQLNLDAAYVYGMRFAHLGLTTLPNHREWTIVGRETKENLRIQVAEVLSRLETIKRRMDEEETAKLRAKLLAQAEEEARRQNRFHRGQEQRRTVRGSKEIQRNGKRGVPAVKSLRKSAADLEAVEEYSLFEAQVETSGLRGDTKLKVKSKGEKAAKKLKKFFNISKSTKKSSKAKPFLNGDSSSQTAVCSLALIRQSRAQHEIQARNQQVVTRYSIEELPVVEEVTLKLHSTQTPSLVHHPSSDETIRREFEKSQKQRCTEIRQKDCQEERDTPTVPPVVGGNLPGIAHRLQLANCYEKGLVDRYDLVMNELKPKLASMYTGHHVIVESAMEENNKSIDTCVFRDSNTATTHTNEDILSDSKHEKDEYLSAKESTKDASLSTKDTSLDTFAQFDAFLAKKEFTEDDVSIRKSNDDSNIDTFDQFDAFLAKRGLTDEESEYQSFMGFSVLEEGSGGLDKQVGEEKSYLDFTIEETLDDEDIYLEYTVAEESAPKCENKTGVEDGKASKLINSPTCVASDKIVSSNAKQSFPLTHHLPTFQSTNDSAQNYPKVSLGHSMDDDMTYITMDTYLRDIDAREKDPTGEKYKQRIKRILHVDLWNRDVAIVEGAMEELHEIVNNRISSRTDIAEYRGIMAIVRTMIGFQDDERIQFLCCDTLRLLASEPQNKSMINNMDVVSLISRSVLEHPDSQRIQNAARATIAAVYLQ